MIRLSALVAALFLCCAPAAAQQVPGTSTEVRETLIAALDAGDREGVTRAAIVLLGMGVTLNAESFHRIGPYLDPALIEAAPLDRRGAPPGETPVALLRRSFEANAKAPGHAPPEHFTQVPAEYRLVEGIAFDGKTGRLFVGTVVDGRLAYLEKGVWHDVAIGGPRGGLFGMAVDPRRRLLWIATGSPEQTAIPAAERMTGLIAVDLDRLAVVRRIALPGDAPGVEGDLAVARDGTVYASNSVTGAIHRCRPGCTKLEELVPKGRFDNPQGLAPWRDGKRLFVADYIRGLWVVDTRTGAVTPAPIAKPMMLEGIDGLMLDPDNDSLVAIQDGTHPRRIVELHLTPEAQVVSDVEVAATFPPEGGEPTLGTFRAHGSVVFVADGQWERYGPGGVLKDGRPARPTPIDMISVGPIVVTGQ